LEWKNVYIFYALKILRQSGSFWSFGIFCSHLVYFPRFGVFRRQKSGNTASNHQKMLPRLTLLTKWK
jgi:hypothetical protein